jgi:hypothetical protein
MAEYKKTSPWFRTPSNSLYLEQIVYRNVPINPDDAEYVIETQYKHRPDLLSYDLYGTPAYWWVFMQRNRSVIYDPIYDFVPGLAIRLPRKEGLLSALSQL